MMLWFLLYPMKKREITFSSFLAWHLVYIFLISFDQNLGLVKNLFGGFELLGVKAVEFVESTANLSRNGLLAQICPSPCLKISDFRVTKIRKLGRNSRYDSTYYIESPEFIDAKMSQFSRQSFAPVDFVRSLMNCWVISAHVTGLLSFLLFFSKNPNRELINQFLNAWWPNFTIGFGYQVDVFFLLSGFLVVWNFLSKRGGINDGEGREKGSVWGMAVEVLLYFLHRIFRFWPATLAALLLSLFLGDYGLDTWGKVLTCFTYPFTAHSPMAIGIMWSNRVDLICSTILFATCLLLERISTSRTSTNPSSTSNTSSSSSTPSTPSTTHSLFTYRNSLLLLFVSFLPKVYRFLTLKPRPSYLKLKNAGLDLMLPAYMVEERLAYHKEILYPGKQLDITTAFQNPLKVYVLKHDYFRFHQRIPPFFVGMVLAVVIYRLLEKQQKETEEKKGRAGLHWFSHLLHGCYLCLSLLLALLPLLMSALGKRTTLEELQEQSLQARDESYFTQELPFLPDFFISAVNRPLFAAAWGYLLYRLLLPSSHPLSLPSFISRISHWRLFHYLALYSYGAYSVHMKVLMEVLWKYFPPPVAGDVIHSSSLTVYYLSAFALVYGLSFACGVVIHHLFEVPCQSLIFSPLLSFIGRLLLPKSGKKTTKEN